MIDLKKTVLEKTNQVFEKSVYKDKYLPKLTLLNTYFNWIAFLEKEFPTEKTIGLLNEATLDLVSAFFNAFSGFYRQGIISLRSSIELTTLYVYYFDHPIEFNYFTKESGYKGPLISELTDKQNFLKKAYCSLFFDEMKIKKEIHSELQMRYKELSVYVHGRLGKMQSFNSILISFDENKLSGFINELEKTIRLGNVILTIRFSKDIDRMDKKKREDVYKVIRKTAILEV